LRPYPTPTLKEIIASPSKISLLIPDIYLYNRCGKKGAEKYGAKVSAQFGQAKFIGDTAGTGTDLEQRDRARSDYERIIYESQVGGSKDVWQGIRDRWTSALRPFRNWLSGVQLIEQRLGLFQITGVEPSVNQP
jgi:hypothetical protein